MKNLIRQILKEENLKSDLKRMVSLDGWESTYPLVGDPETLAQLAFDNDPMQFMDSLVTKRVNGKYADYFGNHESKLFLQFTRDIGIVEVNNELSDFLRFGFKLDKDGARNVIKDWLFNRHGIDINSIGKIYI
jgi:hypothetical protein